MMGIILAIPALSEKNAVRLMISEKIIALFLMIDCFESDGRGADVMSGFVMLAAVVIIYLCERAFKNDWILCDN